MTKKQPTRQDVLDAIAAHDTWERTAKDQRLSTVESSIVTLNHEMGEVVGELRTIKWLAGGTLFMAAGAAVKLLFGL